MSAFDTALTPTAVTPADTADTTLDPNHADDCSVLVDVAVVPLDSPASPGSPGEITESATVRVGITPSGGSVHWKKYEETLNDGQSFESLGPYFLQVGDVLTVGTNRPDEVTFSLTGVESTP